MLKRFLLSTAIGLGCSPGFGQGVVVATPQGLNGGMLPSQEMAAVPVAGGNYALGGDWGMGLPVVPRVSYPNYYQGYFDPGIGSVPVSLGHIVSFGGMLYLQNADGTLTLFR